MIDIVQPSPAVGRGWHVLHATTTCGAISAHEDGTAPAAHASPHPSSPCAWTGSDALVGILVVDKEEPSSKRGHGDACASAGGVRTATLASRPLREGCAPAVRVRRQGVWDRSNEYCTDLVHAWAGGTRISNMCRLY